jgi:lipopolysaccharide biosynthesis protein
MKNDIVLFYAYYEQPVASYNLSFFVTRLRDNIDYVFVINGHTCSVEIPFLPNVKVIKRDNIGFDFGAYRAGIDSLGDKKYDYYFFMNCGVIGPILPWYCQDMDWTKVFTSKINDKVKCVGTTIMCPSGDIESGNMPTNEGFFFVTDHQGLTTLLTDSNVFTNHATKADVVFRGEYKVTECLFRNGYTVDCIMRKYQGVDWHDVHQWKNPGVHISRPGFYYDTSMNPYELIFYKWFWNCENQLVNPKIIHDYVNEFK